MPKITIYEKDLTTAGVENLTTNVAYVPGYAIMGPVNTPVLCQTLSEFQELFGYVPYKFKNAQSYASVGGYPSGSNQAYNNLYMFQKDSYETSYVYAAELLKQGLPVLFERVMSDSDSWYASYKFSNVANGEVSIQAEYPGSYGKNLSIDNFSKIDSDYFITVRLASKDIGLPKDIVRSYQFSFDPNSDNYYNKVDFELITVKAIPSSESIESDIVISDSISTKTMLELNKSEDEFTVSNFYTALASSSTKDSIFSKLTDRNEYQIKFITAGGYPTFEWNKDGSTPIATTMLKVAAVRGDAVALIDHTNLLNRKIAGMSDNSSLYYSVQEIYKDPITIEISDSREEDARKYGAMFTPWATYSSKVLNLNFILAPSFAYLTSLATSVKTNANWYAIAGVTRGLVPNLLQLNQNVTGAIANDIQPENGISINPITNIKPYGYCIWGNRTLNKNKGLVASSFLNIRALTNDVKKVVYTAAKKLTFELNSDVLWLNFKSEIEPTLDKMVSGNGLTNYKILRKASTKRATIEAVIRLYVVEAVEDWDITVELSDTTVTVQ